jgi:cation transport ATPase
MITGDNPVTARVIGHSVGLAARHSPAITGDEFSELDDQQAKDILTKTNIYARISPEDKLRIVSLLRNLGACQGSDWFASVKRRSNFGLSLCAVQILPESGRWAALCLVLRRTRG